MRREWANVGLSQGPMLTCSGCRVARFCNTDHQKMASKKAALAGNLRTGRHKIVCGVFVSERTINSIINCRSQATLFFIDGILY
jgi:hypothetical protein